MTCQDIPFEFTVETTLNDEFPNTDYKGCFSNDYDLSPFVTTSSMMSMLLGTECLNEIELMQTKNARVSVHTVEKKERVRTWKKYVGNSGLTSSSDSSSESDDSDDSSESFDSPRTSSPVNNSKLKIPKNRNSKVTMSEDEKRKYVMNLNQSYANQLKVQKDMVVEAFKDWKKKETARVECSRERKKWAYLNKKYTTMKRRNAREIFDKVQSLNRKMNIPSNVYDLHGQGVKCGNFEYILKRILKSAEKKKVPNGEGSVVDGRESPELVKINDSIQTDETKIILDIGNQKDGEWHAQAYNSTVSYLTNSSVQYEIDNTNRYITIYP